MHTVSCAHQSRLTDGFGQVMPHLLCSTGDKIQTDKMERVSHHCAHIVLFRCGLSFKPGVHFMMWVCFWSDSWAACPSYRGRANLSFVGCCLSSRVKKKKSVGEWGGGGGVQTNCSCLVIDFWHVGNCCSVAERRKQSVCVCQGNHDMSCGRKIWWLGWSSCWLSACFFGHKRWLYINRVTWN